MKKLMVIAVLLSFMSTGCTSNQANHIEAITPMRMQHFIGRFEDNVSLYRGPGDKLTIQKEQEKGFDIYSIDINAASLHYEYSVAPLDNQLYFKQLDADNTLRIKQLGNSEENNVLILEGKEVKTIAKQIAYSQQSLVSVSPSHKYILFCTVGDILNRYNLQLYNRETDKTMLLIESVDEDILNDMEGNLSWSPGEAYLAVNNKQVFNVENGKLIKEINAESITWSNSGSKLAYIKSENELGKTISVFDIKKAAMEEVFVVNRDEYLPGYIVWNENETKLAVVTASIKAVEGIKPYKGIYSLDLLTKEAVRVDTALQIGAELVAKLENIQYNSSGNILALTITDSWGSNLYIYNMITNEWQYFLNIEYLHDENNEDYICSVKNRLYFVQGQGIIELDENMNFKQIHKSKDILEDIYISRNGNSMIIIEKLENKVVLRQLTNFSIKRI